MALNWFLSETELDDVKVLPIWLQHIYTNPYKALDLDRDRTDIQLLRETFRKHCLALIPEFSGLRKGKLTEMQLNFAYNLIRGTLQGPAQRLNEILATSPHMDFRAEYILPTLRPMRGNNKCASEYRGFRMLAISRLVHRTALLYGFLPKTVFVFDVNYVMRRHKIERDFESFVGLHKELEKELLTLPTLPDSLIGLQSSEEFGAQLAAYLMRIHVMLANQGFFSPRLMKFLEIDYEKVQTEEEGVLISILDSEKPAHTVWHMIDEQWLLKWRKFVKGRGPRRYFPPGKITNGRLTPLLKKSDDGQTDLCLGRDYRCVNFNVWRFYELVHGGGPVISRQDQDIYSSPASSYLQAVIRIQTRMRIFLSKRSRDLLYVQRLSAGPSAQGVMLQRVEREVHSRAESLISEHRQERIRIQLEQATAFTLHLWRLKKEYMHEENLEKKKKEQEVFAKTKGISKDVAPSADNARIVQDVQSIVRIGGANVYEKVLKDAHAALPFTIGKVAPLGQQYPGTSDAVVTAPREEKKGSYDDSFLVGSKILSVNGIPTECMSYEEIKSLLAEAPYPITLRLCKPPNILSMIPCGLDDLNKISDSIVQFNAFKLFLSQGVPLLKHNKGNLSSHLTMLKITDKEVFYRKRLDLKKKEDDLWNSFSLFRLKFVADGYQSDSVSSKFLNPSVCFEMVTDERSYVFEVPTDAKLQRLQAEEEVKPSGGSNSNSRSWMTTGDSGRSREGDTKGAGGDGDEASVKSSSSAGGVKLCEERCKLIVTGLRNLVTEIRGTQTFVDKEGKPIKRVLPKISYRKIE